MARHPRKIYTYGTLQTTVHEWLYNGLVNTFKLFRNSLNLYLLRGSRSNFSLPKLKMARSKHNNEITFLSLPGCYYFHYKGFTLVLFWVNVDKSSRSVIGNNNSKASFLLISLILWGFFFKIQLMPVVCWKMIIYLVKYNMSVFFLT